MIFMVKILTFLLLLPVFLLIQYVVNKRDHNRIHDDLKRRNFQLLDIRWQAPPLLSRGGHYEVTYSTPELELYIVQCKAPGFSKLYWSEPEFLFKVSPNQWKRMLHQKQLTNNFQISRLKNMTDKGKVVDGLTSSFTQERLWSIRQIQELGEIEEQLIPIIEEMSTTDPDENVREAATVFLLELDDSESNKS
jgi:hypothetical protein